MKSRVLSLALLICFNLTPHLATAFDNKDALTGLDQARAVFDINQGNPSLLALRLELVEESWQQLHDSGLKPQFVLTFRGRASRFLTKARVRAMSPSRRKATKVKSRNACSSFTHWASPWSNAPSRQISRILTRRILSRR